jgi:hypothetical protein
MFLQTLHQICFHIFPKYCARHLVLKFCQNHWTLISMVWEYGEEKEEKTKVEVVTKHFN